MQEIDNKQLLLNSLAKCTQELRGDKSQFILASEYEISTSIINTIERGLKDPQLTTVFKLAEALNIEPYEFIKRIQDGLPKDFSLTDK